jgi:hypothetical protein
MCANYAITTTSGVQIFGGRYPDIGIQVSFDDARSWQWFVIDTSAFEANGNFLEVRPDEVLMIYGGSYSPKGNRMQVSPAHAPRMWSLVRPAHTYIIHTYIHSYNDMTYIHRAMHRHECVHAR